MNTKPRLHPQGPDSDTGSPSPLPDPDRMLQLMSSIAVMPGNLDSKRFRLMSELCLDLQSNLLISQTLNLSHPGEGGPGQPQIYQHSDARGWEPVPQSRLDSDLTDLSGILQELTNSLLSPNNEAAKGPEGIKIFSPAAGLIFLADHTGNRLKYHAIARLDDRSAFTRAEIRYAQHFVSRIPWLFREPAFTFVDNEVEQLSPRLKSVLILMLEGEERQHIADDLGLSVHTINSYFKELFRYFKVNSHLRLIQKLHHLNRTSPLLKQHAHRLPYETAESR